MKRYLKVFLVIFLFVTIFLVGCENELEALSVPESQVPTITILAYHRIIDNGPSFIDISTSTFENHLQWLKATQYNVIDFNTFTSFLEGKNTLPEKPVLITFDDGYKETLTNAAPILAKYNLPATLFIYSERIKNSPSPGGLTVSELQELQKLGWSIQAHTISHADLSQFSRSNKSGAVWEMKDNKERLEKLLGTPVTGLAYPYGAYTDEIESWAKEVGFTSCFLIEEGPNTLTPNPYRLKRHMLYAKDTLEDFARKVASAPLNVTRTVPSQAQVINYRPVKVIADVELPPELNVIEVYADLENHVLDAKFDQQKQRIVVETPDLGYGHHNLTIKILGSDKRTYTYGWSFVCR